MIVAGLGFRSTATDADLAAALALAGQAPDRLATLDAKTGALARLAQGLGLPVVGVAEAAVRGLATPTRSARIEARFGTGSLAEAVALVAAGPGARLIGRRIKAGPVTVALAATNEHAGLQDTKDSAQ